MGTIRRFEEIEAWQTARELTRLVYALSKDGALARDFGLRNQMRRAAVSVLSNIAEGFDSRTQALFIEFLGRAKGSAAELRAQAYVAFNAGYISHAQFEQLYSMISPILQLANLLTFQPWTNGLQVYRLAGSLPRFSNLQTFQPSKRCPSLL